jgi:hypothetical protein
MIRGGLEGLADTSHDPIAVLFSIVKSYVLITLLSTHMLAQIEKLLAQGL